VLVSVNAGTFTMGSPASEFGRGADEVQHGVTLTTAFFLGQHEVTAAEWRHALGSSPSNHAGCDRCPVERVSFLDVARFLDAVNQQSTMFRYRLPTEAEWEYACRAGTTSSFAMGETLLPSQANFDSAFPYAGAPATPGRGETVPVESFKPNRWGLFDMEGNVWEWTADWYGPYPAGRATDPSGPSNGDLRVIRGGSFYFDANSARCAGRYTHRPQDSGFSLGVRVAATRRD
jgi:formylglycine-generating enzyme required for sulfatase activity